MKTSLSMLKTGVVAVLVGATLTAISCAPPAQQAAPAASAPEGPTNGRFQIAVANDGERGATMLLLDTVSGETWFFHPPQGPLFNGFWGDVPRVTSPGETWRQAFQMLLQPQPQQQPAPAGQPATGQPARLPGVSGAPGTTPAR